MNKQELVRNIASETGLTKKVCQTTVNKVVSTIASCLARGERVTLVGFGTFQIIEKKARKGRNPQTGKEIQIPAKKVPKFVPGKSLKEKVK